MLNKENANVIIKRYFHIVNDILQKDNLLKPENRYKPIISNFIVQQFVSLLGKVLSFGFTKLFIDLKMWRKKLAMKITDKAFESMKEMALKELKIDIDKGFQEEDVKTLEKGYRKRNFTPAEIEKYLNGLLPNKELSYDKPKNNIENKKERIIKQEKDRLNFQNYDREEVEKSSEDDDPGR